MLERWYITPGRITLGISLTFFLIKSFAGSTILIKKIRISRTTAISWLIGISYWKAWVIGRTSRILKIIIGVKRVRVNVKRTKMIISIENTGKVTEEEKFPCAVFFFLKGDSDSTLCQVCSDSILSHLEQFYHFVAIFQLFLQRI